MTVAVYEPVQVISSCLEDLSGGASSLDDKDVVCALRQIEELTRKAQSVMLGLVAEIETRGIAGREGFGTTPRMLSAMLRLSATEARTRVEQAALVGPRRAMTGQPLEPRLPATAAALAEGQIGAGQLKVITDTMAALPASVPEPVRERVEADLADYARDFDPRRLRIIAHRMLAILDPDGPEPREDPTPATPTRGELWLRNHRDGRLGLDRVVGSRTRQHGPRPDRTTRRPQPHH